VLARRDTARFFEFKACWTKYLCKTAEQHELHKRPSPTGETCVDLLRELFPGLELTLRSQGTFVASTRIATRVLLGTMAETGEITAEVGHAANITLLQRRG
jgi:hypothetical protein